MNEFAIFLIFVVAAYDLWLVGASKSTISQAFQRMFSKRVDLALMVAFTAGVAVLPIWAALKVGLGVVIGHLCWAQRETHK